MSRTKKLLLFDFDQTLAVTHLYYMLEQHMGEDEPEDADYAVRQLEIWKEVYGTEKDVDDVFGGGERRVELRRFLEDFKEMGSKLVIISHGYEQVVREVAERAGLGLFDEIIGCDTPEAVQLMCDKSKIANFLLKKYEVEPRDALLVDDDHRNLACNSIPTLWVWNRTGLNTQQLETIRSFVKGPGSGGSPGSYSKDKTALLPNYEPIAHDYLVMTGVLSVESAITKCNSVPYHLRVEPLKIIRTPAANGRSIYTLLFPSFSRFSEFCEISRKYTPAAELPVVDHPTTEHIFKKKLPEGEGLLRVSATGSYKVADLVEAVSQEPSVEVLKISTESVNSKAAGCVPVMSVTLRRKTS